jgi:hypothetical protein
VLDERPEETTIDGAHPEVRVEGDPGNDHGTVLPAVYIVVKTQFD